MQSFTAFKAHVPLSVSDAIIASQGGRLKTDRAELVSVQKPHPHILFQRGLVTEFWMRLFKSKAKQRKRHHGL
jgi:hypothetical protein